MTLENETAATAGSISRIAVASRARAFADSNFGGALSPLDGGWTAS